MSALPLLAPLSLYVHIPWCLKKCPYCDFNSHAINPQVLDERLYIEALLADLTWALPSIQARPLTSVFTGGGTPSLFTSQSIARLLTGIQEHCNTIPNIEITLEANPGVADKTKFQQFAEAGVTRLSLGIQSFLDHHLQTLGRIHNGAMARQAVDDALACFERVNIDLMYALPRQTPQEALSDCAVAIASGVSHISAYELTLEPNTAFGFAPPPDLPHLDRSDAIAQAIHRLLQKAHWTHYEVSAFAQHHHYCQHNMNYWQFGDYLGIGAGAHSKLTTHQGIVRAMRHKHPNTYITQTLQKAPIQSQHVVPSADLVLEFMMNTLRLEEGFTPLLFAERTGLAFNVLNPALALAQQKGFLTVNSRRIKPSQLGRRFLNDLLMLFMPS